MKFKVGDTVLINPDLDINFYDTSEIGWDSYMEKYLNNYVIIIKYHDNGNYQVEFSDGDDWCYYEKDLISINKIRLEKLNDI